MSAELAVPDEAVRALGPAVHQWEITGQDDDEALDAVRAIAASVVAAELREWADDVDNDCWSLEALPAALRRRADELEAQS